jgi:hypothetical protein
MYRTGIAGMPGQNVQYPRRLRSSVSEPPGGIKLSFPE